MKLELNFQQFEQFYKEGITLDMLFLLYEIQNDSGIMCLEHDDIKIEILFQTIVRKGLCTKDRIVTITGKELLNSLTKEHVVPIKRNKIVDDSFDRWYKAFPSTDTFKYKGKTFSGSRSLKAKKDDCKIKLKAILNEGEYTIEEMIKALEFEVIQKKENSIKTGVNKLSYMQNSCTYLHQKSYESFIELIKEGMVVKEEFTPSTGGTNI